MYRRLFVAVVALLRSSLPTCLSTSQKGFEECEGGDSYRASGKSLPPPLIVRSSYTQLSDAVTDLFDLLAGSLQEDTYTALLDGGGFYLSSSPP